MRLLRGNARAPRACPNLIHISLLFSLLLTRKKEEEKERGRIEFIRARALSYFTRPGVS